MGVLDLMGYVQKQGEMGRQRGQENRLSQLSSQAYSATPEQRTPLLADMARTSPEAARTQQTQFRQLDTDAAADLSRKAGQFVALAEMGDEATIAAAYPVLAQEAQRVLGQPLPPTYDRKYLAGIQKLAGAGGKGELPTSAQEFALTQGNPAYAKFLADKVRPQYGNLNGTPIEMTGSGYVPVPAAGGQPQPAPSQGGGVQFTFDDPQNLPPQVVAGLQRQEAAAGNRPWTANTPDPYNGGGGGGGGGQSQQGGTTDIYSQPTPPIELSASIKSLWPALSPEQRKQAVEADAGVGLTAQQQEAKDRADREEKRKIAEEKAAAAGGGKTTDDAKKAAGYASRMEAALGAIARYETSDPKANNPGLGTAALDLLPDSLGNYGKTEGRQNVEAAQLDALDAALTLNTGAAYTKEQLRGMAKAYFPQPGNSPEVVKEKALRLETLISTARVRAGSAAQPRVGSGGGPIPVRSAADYSAVPSGAEYMAPDGSIRRKK